MEGGGGFGGGPGGGPGRGGRGSRWNLSVYHTWTISDRVRIAPGTPWLDQLVGEALTAGGVPRHEIEMEGGLFANGLGARLKGTWSAPSRVDGSGAPGSSDLRFGSTFDLGLRLFVDFDRRASLIEKMPFLKGARLSFTVDNLLDSRQRVTDETGATPYAYQRAFREPQGRVIGIDLRKMF
ncbi:TonB-dependent receptor [Novosphingobium colocasiae]